ncbi:acyl carrier protein [Bosea psychrotolerans]|uniref:Acyl carrier protein n=1 Tax=Bosea psychrotolerans TaxID=1871628 RepID=A0A2S4M814_9HYPH|nr:acyl carrier protein [Bosea psychrotolerans]POR50878.1 acyl carrier protein [Bosea psychrotolerans]
MKNRIRDILKTTARLPIDVATLADDADLHNAGLTSFGTVELMMALEEAFEVEFPDKMMNRRNFASVVAIENAIQSIQSERV